MTPSLIQFIRINSRKIEAIRLALRSIGKGNTYPLDAVALILQYEPLMFTTYFEKPSLIGTRWQILTLTQMKKKFSNTPVADLIQKGDRLDNGKYLIFAKRGTRGSKGTIENMML